MVSFKKKKRPTNMRSGEKPETYSTEEDTDAVSALSLASAARSRRNVLNVLSKKKVTAADTLKSAAVSKAAKAQQEKGEEVEDDTGGKERQNLNFSGATGKAQGSDGVLENKKKKIMEDYIARNGTLHAEGEKEEVSK